MTTPSSRTFTHAAILLGVGLFALGGASLIEPLRMVERWIVKQVAEAIDPVDTIVDGQGSQEVPWTRRMAVPPMTPPPVRVLMIDEDPEHWFSASPLAPVDHATIFARLADVGHKTLGVGHLMAWDEPQPLAMDALRQQLDRFDGAVLALPLARGAAPEPVAAPFLRWSIEAKDAQGNVSALPQVNRIAIPNAELGGGKTLAGFSILENEKDPGDDTQPLLAQWGERVIFSFPLAVEIAAQGMKPEDVMVDVGHEIRLGRDGQVIPIDGFGRAPVGRDVQVIEAPAMRLIYEKNSLPAMEHPLITRDIRAGLPPAEKAWSDGLAASVQALRQAQRFQPAVALPRPDTLMELALMLGMVFLGTWATCQRHVAWRAITALMLAGIGAELLYLFASRQNLWLPPLAILSPGLTAFGLAFLGRRGTIATTAANPGAMTPIDREIQASPAIGNLTPQHVDLPDPVERESWPEDTSGATDDEESTKPARKAAKKAAAKKAVTRTVAKKAARKTPAKKTARKSPPKITGQTDGVADEADDDEATS